MAEFLVFKNTLIGLAQILWPLIVVFIDASKPSAFWTDATIIMDGIVPLFVASNLPAIDATVTSKISPSLINLNSHLKALYYYLAMAALLQALVAG